MVWRSQRFRISYLATLAALTLIALVVPAVQAQEQPYFHCMPASAVIAGSPLWSMRMSSRTTS
jgi:hypothetical protein